MFALFTAATLAAVQLVAASPLPQATSASSASAASASDGATIVSGFIPSPGGVPNETLYVVTASDATYLAGIATVTSTASGSSPTTAVEKDLFVVTNDTLDYYVFNGTDTLVEAVECTIDGNTGNCNGTLIDLSQGIRINQGNGPISGSSAAVTAYAPTGTADPSAVSFATAAPSLLASATSSLSSLLSSLSAEGDSIRSSASADVASLQSSLSANLPTGAPQGNDFGGAFTFPVAGGVTINF